MGDRGLEGEGGGSECGEAAAPPSHTLGQTLWPLSVAAPRGPQEVPKPPPPSWRAGTQTSPGLCCLVGSTAEPHASRWPRVAGSEPVAAGGPAAGGAQVHLRQVAAGWGSPSLHDHPGTVDDVLYSGPWLPEASSERGNTDLCIVRPASGWALCGHLCSGHSPFRLPPFLDCGPLEEAPLPGGGGHRSRDVLVLAATWWLK